jgi:hypothetical protein
VKVYPRARLSERVFEVNFLRSPTNADANPPPSGFQLMMTEFSEAGKCTKVQREF